MDELYAGLLPADKVQRVDALTASESKSARLALRGRRHQRRTGTETGRRRNCHGGGRKRRSDRSGRRRTDGRQSAPDSQAVALSRRTMRIVMQNIVFAIGIKAAMLLLGAFGIADMWEAVFADVGVTVLAVLNSLRAMRSNNPTADTDKTVSAVSANVRSHFCSCRLGRQGRGRTALGTSGIIKFLPRQFEN